MFPHIATAGGVGKAAMNFAFPSLSMPTHVPTELNLDVPIYEEDIGDLSPYSVPLSGFRTTDSSYSINSSPSRHGVSGVPYSDIPRVLVLETPMRGMFDKFPQDEGAQSKGLRKLQVEISSLTMDTTAIVKMRRWVLAFAVVEFDIDIGPTVDALYPPLTLRPAEMETLAFCALPDSMQFDQGVQTHSFRIREQISVPPDCENRPLGEDGFIYGFSYFIQRRDSKSKRGYQQRSLVMLTKHQYPSLFSSIVSHFGPQFEAHGTPMLEAACHNIAKWPDPDPGRLVELGFLGSVLHVEIPHSIDVQQMTETSFNGTYNPMTHILATTAPLIPSPLLLFESALTNLWSIWECLVLCEPILVFGASAAQTSQAIWWMRDLLRPIPLAGDIRPYFTMQDSDSSQLVNKLPPKPGIILGVTNPFFEKSCLHWPHLLSLGRRDSGSSKQHTPMLGQSAGPPPGWKTRTHKRYISKDRVLLKQLENAIKGNDRARLEASLALRRHFCSRSAQVITPVARYLNTLIPSPSEVQRVRLASEFSQSSLSPSPSHATIPSSATLPSLSASASQTSFSSSMNSSSSLRLLHTPARLQTSESSPGLTPTENHCRPRHGLRLKPFNNANFFASLKAHGNVLPFKSSSKRTEFYERWLKSPAFGTWLAQQEQIVQNVLNDAPASAISAR